MKNSRRLVFFFFPTCRTLIDKTPGDGGGGGKDGGDKGRDFFFLLFGDEVKVKSDVLPEEWMEGLGEGRGLLAERGDNPAPV